jgi:hypothetical protein
MKSTGSILLMDENSCNPPVNGTKQLISDGLSRQCTRGKKRKEERLLLGYQHVQKWIQEGRENL